MDLIDLMDLILALHGLNSNSVLFYEWLIPHVVSLGSLNLGVL